MATREKQGKVIPFRQSTSFYMKRGNKEMERNDLVSAMYQYRKAYDQDPTDPDTSLAVAEILSQMQRYEESNRILLLQMSMGKLVPECYFGLACNYFGMHEFDYAAESLENYLEADPDGFFALDAEDFLDVLDDDEAMRASTGLFTDEDYETDGVCMDARHLLDSMETKRAIELLESHVKRYPNCVRAQNQLSLAYYCNGEKDRALKSANTILRSEPHNQQALCNRALFLHEKGEDAGARADLARLLSSDTQSVEILNNISVLLITMERYQDAEKTLAKIAQQTPYDANVIHRTAYCRYMLGNAAGALSCYRKLLRINPNDTVAKYYFSVCKRNERDRHPAFSRWSVPYQVPFAETFRRLNYIKRCLEQEQEQLLAQWQNDINFRNIIVWALDLTEPKAKQSMLALLFSFGDKRAEYWLRDFILRTNQPDAIKHSVFGMLKKMGVPEPYVANIDGRWISGRVSMLDFTDGIPPVYADVIRVAVEQMSGVRSEESLEASIQVFQMYTDRLKGVFPRMNGQQAQALSAAIEFLGCTISGESVEEAEICKKYRVSATRLHNAIVRLRPEPEE